MIVRLSFRNRQRIRTLDLAQLRRVVRHLLTAEFQTRQAELGFHLVAAPEMARVNQTFLQHAGSTDVITFNHTDSPSADSLHGEVFICLDDAVAQAKQFRTTWQSELVRYVIHALLHLRGYDDRNPAARRKMKREENRLLRQIVRRFPLRRLARSPARLRP